jgi:hypothetical protein
VKSNQRLDSARLAEALEERGLVEHDALLSISEQSVETGILFTEILVQENLVTDWELSRLSCELFGLAFFPVDVYQPAAGILDGLDQDFLRRWCIVPLDRYGDVLTVALPAMVPTEALTALGQQADCKILPVAGTVNANRAWLAENLQGTPEEVAAAIPEGAPEGDWMDMFDAGDQAVQMDLDAQSGMQPEDDASSAA